MLFYYIFTECVIPDVLNNRTHVKSTKGHVLLYPEITPPATIVIIVFKPYTNKTIFCLMQDCFAVCRNFQSLKSLPQYKNHNLKACTLLITYVLTLLT